MQSPDELLLGIDLDAPEVEHRPLANGINPWKRVLYDPAAYYRQQLAERGVEATCEGCGKVWKVHPMLANRAQACSKKCRQRVWWHRKHNGKYQRPLWPNPWLNGEKAS